MQTCNWVVFCIYDTNFKTYLKSKCLQCTITINFRQSGYPRLYPAHKASICKQMSYFFDFVFLLVFFLWLFLWQSTTFWCTFISFLHAVQLLPADIFLLCFFLPSGTWETENPNLGQTDQSKFKPLTRTCKLVQTVFAVTSKLVKKNGGWKTF